MKYIKLYEGFMEEMDKEMNKISSDINKSLFKIRKNIKEVKKLDKLLPYYETIMNIFKEYNEDDELFLNIDIDRFIVDNIVNIDNDQLYIIYHEKRKTNVMTDHIGVVPEVVIIGIVEELEKRYPEYFEGDAMGFFNVKEDIDMITNEEITLLKNIRKIFDIVKKNDKVIFNPPIKIKGTLEYFTISRIREDDMENLHFTFQEKHKDTDLTEYSFGLLEKFYKEFLNRYPGVDDAEAMGFFNVKEGGVMSDMQEKEHNLKLIRLAFNSYSNNNILKLPNYTIKEEDGILKGGTPYDFTSYNLSWSSFETLKRIVKEIREKYPDFNEFEEGNAMGFFNAKD